MEDTKQRILEKSLELFSTKGYDAVSEEKAVAFLEQVRAANRTARHNVYAYRLREGNRERYSDDGEPAKTAGTPALEVLQHSGLTDLVVVITRYFGGVLLGTGGLVRAYTTATARALEAAEVVTAIPANCWKNAFGMPRRRAKTVFAFCVQRGANGSFSPTPSF